MDDDQTPLTPKQAMQAIAAILDRVPRGQFSAWDAKMDLELLSKHARVKRMLSDDPDWGFKVGFHF